MLAKRRAQRGKAAYAQKFGSMRPPNPEQTQPCALIFAQVMAKRRVQRKEADGRKDGSMQASTVTRTLGSCCHQSTPVHTRR